MYKLYTVRYHAQGLELLGLTSEENVTVCTFEVRTRYQEIITEEFVPCKFNFLSTYRGEEDTEIISRNSKPQRVHYRYNRETWQEGLWNYTPEDFEKQVNGALHIPHFYCGTPLSPEEFQVFKKTHPKAKRGFYNYYSQTWELLPEE